MDKIIPAYQVVNDHFIAPPGKVGLLYGAHNVYATATLVASEIIRHQHPVVFVDGANRIDPHYLARLARYRNIPPKTYLDRAYVSRAFTFYQMDVSMTDGLLEFMQSVHSHVLVVFGLLNLADDDQVPMKDVFDIMVRIKESVENLKVHHISTLLASPLVHFQMKDRERLFQLLPRMSDVFYRLESGEGSNRIIIEGEPHGTFNPNRHDVDPAGRTKLVKLPAGAQKRGTRFIR